MPPVMISFVFALFTVALSADGAALLSDPDTAWHIAAGDLIYLRHSVYLTNTWSFSAPDYAWRDISWLWDMKASWLATHAGLQSLVAWNVAIIAAVMAGVAWQCLKRGAGLANITLVLLALAMNAGVAVRPQSITFLFTLAAAALLRHVHTHPERRKCMVLLPLLTAFWVNFHGGFIVMFLLLAAYKWDVLSRHEWRECTMISATGAACLLAALINPYGIHIWGAVADTLLSTSKNFIVEWQPMRFNAKALLWTFPVPLFLLLIRPNDVRFSMAEKIIAYVFLVLAVGSNRQYFLFLIVIAPMISVAIQPWFATCKREPWPPAEHMWRFIERQRLAALVLALIAAIACATPWYERETNAEPLRLPGPDAGIDFIETHYPQVKFFNAYNFGGYIVYKTQGALPVFIDGRAGTAYPKQVLDDYAAFWSGAPDWEKRFDRYGIGGLFLERNDPFADRMTHRRGWKMVYEDAISRIFIKEAK